MRVPAILFSSVFLILFSFSTAAYAADKISGEYSGQVSVKTSTDQVAASSGVDIIVKHSGVNLSVKSTATGRTYKLKLMRDQSFYGKGALPTTKLSGGVVCKATYEAKFKTRDTKSATFSFSAATKCSDGSKGWVKYSGVVSKATPTPASGPCQDLGMKPRITGGVHCSESNSPVVPFLVLYPDNMAALCSATYVGNKTFITAAHCFLDLQGSVEVDVMTPNGAIGVTSYAVHPKYDPETVDSAYDVALFRTTDEPGLPAVPLLLSDPIRAGEQITIYGYGQDEKGRSFLEAGFDSLKATRTKISSVDSSGIQIFFDTTNSGICNGDSGGPVIQIVGGVAGIVGLNSYGIGGCTAHAEFGLVNLQKSDVVSFIRSAAPTISFK